MATLICDNNALADEPPYIGTSLFLGDPIAVGALSVDVALCQRFSFGGDGEFDHVGFDPE